MPGRGNGRSPTKSYKKDQKNVSVYLGKATGWEAKALEAVCAHQRQKESQFFRLLFLTIGVAVLARGDQDRQGKKKKQGSEQPPSVGHRLILPVMKLYRHFSTTVALCRITSS